MLETIKNAWRIVEIRKKILFTLFIIIIFRIGSVLPVPFVNLSALGQIGADNDFFNYLSVLTGGGLQYGSIFAMSVTPYINASIILQLLTVAIPYLERLSKEGEEGRKKIAQFTRYGAVILGLVQGVAYFFYLKNSDYLIPGTTVGFWSTLFAGAVIVAAFTAGSALVMWLGEQIDVKGIGNGISIILFSGIIARGPDAFAYLWAAATDPQNPQIIAVIGIILVFVLVIAFIVWMTRAERRVPVQYAKRVVGRKQYGGQNSHIPFKVNMSGVMPIIFASSILMLPTMILGFMDQTKETTWIKILALFSSQGVFYAVLYFFLIIAFAYFYAQIQYNPVEVANNIRKNGGSVPGIRPGKSTSDFFAKIISRITLLGALFLSVIAILPIIIGSVGGLNIAIGGTSVLIMVGVALDTVQNLESQMMMRHYKGFLD